MIEINEPITEELRGKLKRLEVDFRDMGSLAVGFSGGVDSSFLLAAAHAVLGDRVIAVTGSDASVPERELKEAKTFCEESGFAGSGVSGISSAPLTR